MTGSNDTDNLEKYRQKRRRPRDRAASSDHPISDTVDRSYDLIPEIGAGRRWYDYAYLPLKWLGTTRTRNFVPRRLRFAANQLTSYLYPFEAHDRAKAWPRDDWMHNVHVPDDAQVSTAGVWVVELFPPSQLPAFERALKKGAWRHRRRYDPLSESNAEELQRARSGVGPTWWRIVEVVRKGSRYYQPDALPGNLPKDFNAVEIRAIQVGPGLTAVIAYFKPTKGASRRLNAVWHAEHEPLLLPGSIRRPPHSLDRAFAAYWRTQKQRTSLHDSARTWLASAVPGFFAASGSSAPLLDLLLLEGIDPYTLYLLERQDREHDQAEGATHRAPASSRLRYQVGNALRALGLTRVGFRDITSPSFPQMVLAPSEGKHLNYAMGEAPTWTLWGNRDAVRKSWAEKEILYSSHLDSAVAYRVESMYNLLVMRAVSEYAAICEAEYAQLRDRATTKHGKFRPRALKDLRGAFLTLSIDLATVRREANEFWSRKARWNWEGGKDFFFTDDLDPDLEERFKRPPDSFSKRLRRRQNQSFSSLASADRDYRDILSTVASLGASADSFKIGRWALWVALVSLGVAITTIVISDLGCNSVIYSLFGWPALSGC